MKLSIDIRKILAGLWKSFFTHAWPWLGTLGSLLLLIFNQSLLPWLHNSFVAHPHIGFSLLALMTTCFSMGFWLRWKKIARLALKQAAKVPVLRAETKREKRKNQALEARLSMVAISKDDLKVITFLFKHKQAHATDVGKHTGLDEAADGVLKKLAYEDDLVRQTAPDPLGRLFYALNDKGDKLAESYGVTREEAPLPHMRATELEAEVSSLWHLNSEANARVQELEKKLRGTTFALDEEKSKTAKLEQELDSAQQAVSRQAKTLTEAEAKLDKFLQNMQPPAAPSPRENALVEARRRADYGKRGRLLAQNPYLNEPKDGQSSQAS